HAHVKPAVRIGRRIHGPLVLPRVLVSQLAPRIPWLRDVLYRVLVSHGVAGLAVARAPIHGVGRRVVHAMERHPPEALPLHVLTPDVELDRAVAELDAPQVRKALAGGRTQMYPQACPVRDTARRAVDDIKTLGVEGPLLADDT